MSKSQSKELFKKKQRGRTKKGSIGAGAVSSSGPTVSAAPMTKLFALQSSQGGANGYLNGGEDPALVIINPQPPTLNQPKEKRTKICCLL